MWILLSLISAVSDSFKNIFVKRSTEWFDPVIVAWAWTVFSLAILIPAAFVKGIPQLDGIFWISLGARTILDAVAFLLYAHALRRTDLSLSLPLLALTPLFLFFAGMFINQEFPTVLGLLGVGMVVVGVYFLNFKKGERFYEPFLAIYRDKGIFMMFGVSIIWGFTSALHKLAITHSNPYFYAGVSAFALALALSVVALVFRRGHLRHILQPENLSVLIPAGFLEGVAGLAQMLSQALAPSVLVISVKRTSVLFSSILGKTLLKEPTENRFLPTVIMIIGAILISIS